MTSKPYLHLFNAITDALECIREGRLEEADAILRAAQQTGEELYIQELEKSEDPQKTE